MYLYVPMEVKARELIGRSLLAFAAAETGWTVVLGRKGDVLRAALSRRSPPGVWFDKSLGANKADLLERLVSAGHSVVSQDEEGGITHDSYEPFARKRFAADTLELVSGVYCWGRFDWLGAQQVFPTSKEKFVITGSPRVDLWRPELRSAFRHEMDVLLKKYGKFVLFVSTFGRIHNHRSVGELVQYRRGLGHFATAQDEAEFKESLAYQRDLRDEFSVMLRQLAHGLGRRRLIVRPHPAEDPAHWRRLMADVPNASVVQDGTIDAWVHAADVVIHNSCTTGFQAEAANVPTVAYTPFHSRFDLESANAVGHRAIRREDAISITLGLARCEDGWSGACRRHEVSDVLRQRVANLEGRFAADRIVGAISELNVPRVGASSTYWRARMLLGRAASTIGRQPERSGLGAHKFPSLSLSELTAIRMRLDDAVQRFSKVDIRPLGKAVYRVSTVR